MGDYTFSNLITSNPTRRGTPSRTPLIEILLRNGKKEQAASRRCRVLRIWRSFALLTGFYGLLVSLEARPVSRIHARIPRAASAGALRRRSRPALVLGPHRRSKPYHPAAGIRSCAYRLWESRSAGRRNALAEEISGLERHLRHVPTSSSTTSIAPAEKTQAVGMPCLCSMPEHDRQQRRQCGRRAYQRERGRRHFCSPVCL